MRLLPRKLNINFMGRARYATALSISLVVMSIGSLASQGLNLGVDFEGGTLVEVGYPAPVELDTIRKSLEDAGFERAVVQHFGSAQDVLVRIKPDGRSQSELGDQVLEALRGEQEMKLRRVEYIGPQVGEELRDDGGLAMLYALALILIYVALRFEYRFSIGAVIALVHDVVVTLGFFSLTRVEFDLTVLAALLAVIGYSLNDTIVVFDRIRENFRKLRRPSGTEEVINVSVNQTLARTLMTSLTTLLVLLALFFFGGEVIHAFSIALIVGVVVGTYSSIYVAGGSLLMLGISGRDLDATPVEKVDDRP